MSQRTGRQSKWRVSWLTLVLADTDQKSGHPLGYQSDNRYLKANGLTRRSEGKMNRWALKRRHLTIIVAVTAAVSVQGCISVQTSSQCEAIADPEASVRCLDGVMFGNVAQGAAIGAAGGAVLGGVVSFAASGGRSPGQAIRGAVAGGIAGGVAGGVIAYVKNLNDRTAGDTIRSANMNAANMSAFTRQIEFLIEKISEMNRRPLTIEQKLLIQVIINKADDTTKAHFGARDELPITHDSMSESQRLKKRNDELKAQYPNFSEAEIAASNSH